MSLKRAQFDGSFLPNHATVTYTDTFEEREVRLECYAPSAGGYVRAADHSQVCEGLASMGNTLTWHPSQGPLVELLRREYKRMRRNERRVLS